MKNWKVKKGFTLLELLVVVIIVGILASIAIPQYVKITEKSRASEARSILGTIRTAEAAFFQQNNVYTLTIANLDIDDPNAVPGVHYFSYAVTAMDNAAVPPTFTAIATRYTANGRNPNWTGVGAYTITMDQAGNVAVAGGP